MFHPNDQAAPHVCCSDRLRTDLRSEQLKVLCTCMPDSWCPPSTVLRNEVRIKRTARKPCGRVQLHQPVLPALLAAADCSSAGSVRAGLPACCAQGAALQRRPAENTLAVVPGPCCGRPLPCQDSERPSMVLDSQRIHLQPGVQRYSLVDVHSHAGCAQHILPTSLPMYWV